MREQRQIGSKTTSKLRTPRTQTQMERGGGTVQRTTHVRSSKEDLRNTVHEHSVRNSTKLKTPKGMKVDNNAISPERKKTSNLSKPKKRPKPEPEHSGKKLLTLIGGMLLVAVISVLLWVFVIPHAKSLDTIQKEIGEFYTTTVKSDLKDDVTEEMVDALIADLAECGSSDDVVQASVEKELATVKSYLNDTTDFDRINSADFDLTDPDYEETLNRINTNISNYSVPALGITLTNKLNDLKGEWRDLQNLRLELQSVSTDVTRDPEEYISIIDEKVKHTPNKEAMTKVVSLIKEKHALQNEITELKKDEKKNKDKISEKKKEMNEKGEEINTLLSLS